MRARRAIFVPSCDHHKHQLGGTSNIYLAFTTLKLFVSSKSNSNQSFFSPCILGQQGSRESLQVCSSRRSGLLTIKRGRNRETSLLN